MAPLHGPGWMGGIDNVRRILTMVGVNQFVAFKTPNSEKKGSGDALRSLLSCHLDVLQKASMRQASSHHVFWGAQGRFPHVTAQAIGPAS